MSFVQQRPNAFTGHFALKVSIRTRIKPAKIGIKVRVSVKVEFGITAAFPGN